MMHLKKTIKELRATHKDIEIYSIKYLDTKTGQCIETKLCDKPEFKTFKQWVKFRLKQLKERK